MTSTAAELVTEAKKHIRNLTVDEVGTALDAGSVTLVDIREPDEVQRDGQIPGAVLAPRGMLEFWADPTSPYHRGEFVPDAHVILYCASSGRSALAVRTLQSLGYSDVGHLDGGFKAWKEDGRAVIHET